MIVLFSTSYDISTYEVMTWLHHLGYKDVVRVNTRDSYDSARCRIVLEDGTYTFIREGQTYNIADIKAVWYRKGREWLADQFYQVNASDHPRLERYLNSKVGREQTKLAEYIQHIITTTKPVLGNPFQADLNKMITLETAKACGLDTPDMTITNHKELVAEKCHGPEAYITKSMSDGLYLFEKYDQNKGYFTYTEQVDKEMVDALADTAAPMLMQKAIKKAYEVRSFYLDGAFHSMAIYSQNDQQTKVDFRKYNGDRPNRSVPYILPAEVEEKLKTLFEKLTLNTGSVDLIVDLAGRHVFLEINPVGQFSMVSKPCNLYLEKKVATKLIDYASGTN